MKFFVAITLLAAAASAFVLPANINLTPQELAEIEEIVAAINSPNTDPTTATMLEQMLYDILGIATVVKPPVNIPAIIDQFEPPVAGPALIDFPLPEGAIEETPVAPAAPAAPVSPLVQIIVNVNQEGGSYPSPVQVDHIGEPSPVVVVEQPDAEPTPVHVVDGDVGAPEPVLVGELPEPVLVGELPEPVLVGELPEPVVISPIIVAPAVVGPEILN